MASAPIKGKMWTVFRHTEAEMMVMCPLAEEGGGRQTAGPPSLPVEGPVLPGPTSSGEKAALRV